MLHAVAGRLPLCSGRATDLLKRVDARLPLSRGGLCAGLVGGALYALQSANHMTVQSPADPYVVGLMLAAIGGTLGWLAGGLLRRPLRAADEEGADNATQDLRNETRRLV